jgi:hypothetical protein
VELEGNFYVIDRTRDYLMLGRVNTVDGKTFTIGTKNPVKYTLVWDKSPVEYLAEAQKGAIKTGKTR